MQDGPSHPFGPVGAHRYHAFGRTHGRVVRPLHAWIGTVRGMLYDQVQACLCHAFDVADTHRHRCIGKFLCKLLCEIARRHSCAHVAVSFDYGSGAAKAFWRRCGFVAAGWLDTLEATAPRIHQRE